jgi:hypothetical protein
MKPVRSKVPELRSGHRRSWMPILVCGSLLVLLLAILLPRQKPPPENTSPAVSRTSGDHSTGNAEAQHEPRDISRAHFRRDDALASETPEQIVARRAAQFARSRRDVLHGIAAKLKISVPSEIEQYFAAAEAGDWEQLKALFNKLAAERNVQPHSPELDQLWAPVLASFNALEEVHLWPAKEYLDYGNAILDSLKPGMVYVGGTDAGRGIPELLNETSDGENHVVITQNGLADATYMDYLRFIYGDRFNLPTPEQVQSAYQGYVADYQQRLAHDQEFPDEPKQVLPGEQVGSNSGQGWTAAVTQGDQSVQVSGQVSCMAINERILQMIMQDNPDSPFGLQESFPLKSTYADAAPLGPIMELRAPDGQNALNADSASASLNYWQDQVQQLLADPAAADSPDCMKNYSKLTDAQANLFASHGLNDQAEQAFQLSLQICPSSPEAVYGYVGLLMGQNRAQDALAVAQSAAQADPGSQTLQNILGGLQAPPAAAPGASSEPPP